MDTLRVCALALIATSCSTLQSQYLAAGYDPTSPTAVKRIAVIGWSSSEQPDLATLLAAVATDRLKLKSNYLISHSGSARSWSAACDEREGVLFIRALSCSVVDTDVSLHLVAELYACNTGAMLWRAEAAGAHTSADTDLQELSRSYAAQLGDAVRPWAGPVFILLRDLLDLLPNPILSDDDFLEKIDLG